MFLKKLLKKFFEKKEARILKKYKDKVDQVNALEKKLEKLSDEALKEYGENLKNLVQKEARSLNSVLVESFALVREVSKRTIGLRHYDVQIIGGIVLHEGKIAEMKTGEGKTLVATLVAYLNALKGKGVHIVTVNDYLAKRDMEWMRPIYEFLNLSVSYIQNQDTTERRKEAYACDITYATNNELGFDYLRDNMVNRLEDRVQGDLHFAIIDEVDSILIDEARTPLIISGSAEDSTEMYVQIDQIVKTLKPASKNQEDKWDEQSGDYKHELKDFNVLLTELGISKIEKTLSLKNLYDPQNVLILHHVLQSLKAHILFKKDIDYILEDGKIIIIDEHTGRKMVGRRYSDGLHQAIEAKENVPIQKESQTLASITFQNYFKLYKKISGMTGTAKTEAEEFYKIYQLEVISIPTHLKMNRIDHPDQIYKNNEEKVAAIITEIKKAYKKGQPVLLGTISIEKNEEISKILKKEKIPHSILNAKYHEMEAKIIAQAGKKYAITIATNMAGRGTDIKPSPEVLELGGLYIIGTERHESRRIDNQLRGRSGRQGDPGESRFFLSLEDNLLKLFGSDRIGSFMGKMGFEKGEKIEHRWISKAIANAQKRVENKNFEIRKYLLEYDNVINLQRIYIYKLRYSFLLQENLENFLKENLSSIIDTYMLDMTDGKKIKYLDLSLIKKILNHIQDILGLHHLIDTQELFKNHEWETFKESLYKYLLGFYNDHLMQIPENNLKYFKATIYPICLGIIDSKWKDHLHNLDNLKEGIHLQSYAEKNPLVEYKIEAFYLFENLKFRITESIIKFIYHLDFYRNFKEDSIIFSHQKSLLDSASLSFKSSNKNISIPNDASFKKVGRNELCPCGSQKKYKKCCGK